MNYRRRYHVSGPCSDRCIAEHLSVELPKVGDYFTKDGIRYVVTKVFEPFQVEQFKPYIVNILCEKE
jgi:hypothetical protein